MILIVICEKRPTRWIRMLADMKRAYSDMFPLLRWLRAVAAPWKVHLARLIPGVPPLFTGVCYTGVCYTGVCVGTVGMIPENT